MSGPKLPVRAAEDDASRGVPAEPGELRSPAALAPTARSNVQHATSAYVAVCMFGAGSTSALLVVASRADRLH
ncbi:hypothetical protein PF003_g10266 [Phytophthora fragariae]|nr:hypothetical protein PF003_g10266 [Phytophthora fragariae]